ncbi:MAG: glycosyl hydrolase family 28-related protein [Kiritimatiellales bacterium]
MKTQIRLSLFAALLLASPAAGTAASAPFRTDDSLGINVDDVAALNAMPEQTLLRTGFIDVTKPPFSADPSGARDATKAIADAVFFGRHHKLAVWFPLGTYTVSDTIPCPGGWSDERTPNNKYLPFTEGWPCVLIGERQGSRRPCIVLASKSPGFDNPARPKRVLDFYSRAWSRMKLEAPLGRDIPQTGYHQTLYGIDVRIGSGNPGAAAVSFGAAEGSTIQDCTLEAGDGYTGLLGAPGSGGAVFNLTVRGGQIGAMLNSVEPSPTLVGCRFSGQRETAIHYEQRGSLTLVGCEFELPGNVVAVRSTGKTDGSLSLVDCRLDRSSCPEPVPAVVAQSAAYLRNTWVRSAGPIFVSSQHGGVATVASGGWNHVIELAASFDYAKGPASIFSDGIKTNGIVRQIVADAIPPDDLRTRHILWDDTVFPAWNRPGVVNVKGAPYFAKGDGKADDTAALQRAIDENQALFLPKGAYRISKTLQLKSRTQIIGISPSYSMICPVPAEGGDFNDPANPQSALRTADIADAATQLAFFSVFMPREDVKAAFVLDWMCGGRSLLRCVNSITGYTENELVPLAAGIRPWLNWTWEQVNPLSEYVKGVRHNVPGAQKPHDDFYTKNDTGGTPDWPLYRVHGHGAGGWYPFYALDGRLHGPNSRRILIENTSGPFSIYHAHLQYCCGLAEVEMKNAHNIAIYGIKNEGYSTILRVSDSSNILVAGYGGPGFFTKTGKFIIRNSSDVTLADLINDFRFDYTRKLPPPARHYPLIREELPSGRMIDSGPDERPVLFRSTDAKLAAP